MRALTVITVLVILTQGASASAPFTSAGLSVDGSATLEGAFRAVFTTAGRAEPFAWTLTADAVTLERTYMPWREVADPRGGALYQIVEDDKVAQERLTFTDVRLTSGELEADNGFLALTERGHGTALTSAHMAFSPVSDPTFLQKEPDTLEGANAPPLEIRETVAGQYVLARAPDGTFTLEGDLTLILFGPDYALESREGPYDGRTGFYETRALALLREGHVERQVLTFTKARLQLEAESEVHVLSTSPRLAFAGALAADSPDGVFPLNLASTSGSTWAGQGALDLSFLDGRLGIDAPEDLRATGTATITRSPPLLPAALGTLALLAVVAVVVVLVRRRSAEDDDPLALALLAMEDRRWEDALPHVERALERAPGDAKLLLDRALCLEESGRLSEARDGYEAALRAEPFNAETHYYYARTLARLRNPTGALAHLGRALSLDARLAELARRESAFAGFRDHPQFLGMLG